MKIVKMPIWKEIRKSVKTGTFRTRKFGIIEFGAKRIPRNPRTTAQQSVRNRYGQICEQWRKLSEAEKQQYEELGKKERISGFNVYVRKNFQQQTITPPCLDSAWADCFVPDQTHPCLACGAYANGCYYSYDKDTPGSDIAGNVFLKFDYAIPQGATIISATLKFTLTWENIEDWPGAGVSYLRLGHPDADWSSSTLTWNNQPGLEYEIQKWDVDPLLDQTENPFTVDVTQHIQDRLNAGYDYGFKIDTYNRSTTGNFGWIHSSSLEIIYKPY